jgi:hypothetical protein
VRLWASDILGCDDWFTAHQFNAAVSWFGRYVENRLHEYDDKAKRPKYSLEELLSPDPLPQENPLQRIRSILGRAVKVVK